MSYACLKGKTYIVTGAASGMGRVISRLLARQGANLGLVDMIKPDDVLKDVESEGAKGIAVTCNVQDRKSVDDAFKSVVDHFGSLDGAANMAGTVGKYKVADPALGMSALQEDDWDMIVRTNLDGVKNSMRAELNLMKGPGSIINAASISGQIPSPFNSPYGASKFGVIGLTKSVAQEVGPQGIRVNAIAPGFVKTGLLQSLGGAELFEKGFVGTRVALRRLAEPEDIAKVVLFLFSSESDYITGSVVNIDGGFS